ncbi:Hypothetical predicted protein [Marmota monax]|uniref:Uncharacterized protein n=1 Tax=Marmota monax TaxID=9995 RepID=A0A5E4D6F5_MARMO|nr:hypothetical protein GHT09_017998 [Marmota monax]VTJ89290.1 Hypothetical predicted protein [Marmota monax]
MKSLPFSIWEAGSGGNRVCHRSGGGSTALLVLKGKTLLKRQSAQPEKGRRAGSHFTSRAELARQQDTQGLRLLKNIAETRDSRSIWPCQKNPVVPNQVRISVISLRLLNSMSVVKCTSPDILL